MHLLTVYLPLHHTPHQPPKQFFCLTLSLQTCFFCHIWQILFTLGRHFLLECEIFSVVMATTSYYYGLHLSPALLEMSRFISVCRLYNARAGEKGVALTSMILFEFKPVLYQCTYFTSMAMFCVRCTLKLYYYPSLCKIT